MNIHNYILFLSNKLFDLTVNRKFFKSHNQENYNEPLELINDYNVLTNKKWNEDDFWVQYFNYYNFI
jgi:hypothetical protein